MNSVWSDFRDVAAFNRLLPGAKEKALEKWGDINTWYLCEWTTTISAALREGYKPEEIVEHYKIKIEAVKLCKPLSP